MIIERSFTVEISKSAVIERVTSYMQQAGYIPISIKQPMIFERGRVLGSVFSPSALHWKTRASVRVISKGDEIRISVVIDVNTTGQWPTNKERAFFSEEAYSLEAAVTTGEVDTYDALLLERVVIRQTIVLIIITVCFALGLAYAGWMIVGRPVGIWGGAAIGLSISLVFGLKILGAKFR